MQCASCDTVLPQDARFCPFCGSPCAASAPAAPAEERKVVTVVFCDLVGSTALSGVLDPETLRSVTLRYFQLMRERLEEFGGTVEKFIGDAVVAVFGVPVMHEDDARRAVAATLGMREALAGLNAELRLSLGVRLRVRIGVNTGPVVTGADPSARQALVSGETVNIAARLEQNASEGEILIGHATMLAAGPVARTESVGPLLLKGKNAPVTAHRLLGIEEDAPELLRRFDVSFVGRERELAELDLALDGVAAGREAHLVTVYGEAGMGKTRLVREWQLRSAAFGCGRPVAFGSGRCRPYGDHGSLAPLAEALHQLLAGLTGEAYPRPLGSGTAPQVGDVLDRLRLGDPAERAETGAALALLLAGLLEDGTPNPSVDDTCAAIVCLLGTLARRHEVVLVVDDCHWAGDLLLELLDRLVEELDLSAVLFVRMARIDLLDRYPGWGSGRLRSRSILLPGLSPAECELVAGSLAEVSAHWSGLPARILESAGGNPFYLEQLLATVSESGLAAAGELPPTLHSLLGARLDTLDRSERATLDLAAVLGREFTAGELSALADAEPGGISDTEPGAGREPGAGGARGTGDEVRATLVRLTRRRLVHPLGRSAAAGPSFRFSSGLVHEVAYQSMAKRARADRHERAAALLVTVGEGDARVAGHLEHAFRYRTELGMQDQHTGDLRRRAAELLAGAGSQALARSDLAWARALLERSMGLSLESEPQWATAARQLGEVQLALGRVDEGRTLLGAVLAAASDGLAGSVNAVDTAHARLALAMAAPAAAPRTVARLARELLPAFEAAGDELGQSRACIRMAQEQQLQGRHAEADGLLARGLAHAARCDAEPERALALGAMGISLWRGPQPVPAAVARGRALLAEHGGTRPTVRVTLNCPLAVLLALQEDWDGAGACLAEARKLAEELGYAEGTVVLPVFAAQVEALANRPQRAIDLLDEAAEAARTLKADGFREAAVREAARLLMDSDRLDAAAQRLESVRRAEELPRSDAADLDGLHGRLAAARGGKDLALELTARAVATAAATDSLIVQATARLDQASVFQQLGLLEQAAAALGTALRHFEAKGHRPGVRRAAGLLRPLAAPLPDRTESHGTDRHGTDRHRAESHGS